MKKIGFICLFLILCFTACGKEESGQDDATGVVLSPSPTQMVEDIEDSKVTESEGKENETIYEDTVRVGIQSIFCDYLKGRRTERKMSSYVFYTAPRGNETDTVMLVVADEKYYEGDLEGVIDFYNDGTLFLDLGLYHGTGFSNILEEGEEGWFIEVDSTTPVTIKENNLETLQFTGHVVNDEGTSCYLYGYSFIKEGLAHILMGIVHSPGQEQEFIDSVNNEVDAMIITVRDTRKP